ncbi:MAG: NFACT RNA binding domain-containing protein [Bacillus subtilis]|nr:NFACT RNA binding domain-containing protein [Bacillus subtilis]
MRRRRRYDLLEIAEELKENGYLREKPTKAETSDSSYEVFASPDGVEIVVGKNNLQNDYITNKLAKPTEWWFHTRGIPGSHVLVHSPGPLSEATIRCAANLAAFHSQARNSSSVPVDYTVAKHVKKIPGLAGSFVTIANEKRSSSIQIPTSSNPPAAASDIFDAFVRFQIELNLRGYEESVFYRL